MTAIIVAVSETAAVVAIAMCVGGAVTGTGAVEKGGAEAATEICA